MTSLAKLTENAAHVDMVCAAIAQHDLRVSRHPVAPGASRACSGADRSHARCEQAVTLVRDYPWPRSSTLLVDRASYGIGLWASTGGIVEAWE